ncbi:MAG: ATP-binding cassette domain-containing protein [Clostridiales bacterium]|nr:ATP-binding cassette domain-containing protein [Clostridiales bacterium]
MIEVKNLVKRYGNHLALDNVSFTIEKGEVIGFLGPNGAGKSTTMNIITGYLSSTEGEVRVDGVSVLDEPEKAKKMIGYLPEIPPLYTEMTVDEYLTFVCELKGVPASKRLETVTRIAKQTRISEVRKRLIRNLSKGYRQRVGIAQALVGDPEVLILDEPTVGLDPKQITEVRSLIKDLSENHTLIISSHILAEVQAVCSRVIIINRGRIVATDTPENLARNAIKSNKLELRIKGPKNDVLNGVSAISGVRQAEIIRIREEGAVDVNVETEEGVDVREQIFDFCCENHYPIYMMKTTEANLEDIFLQITGEREAKRS